MEKENRLEGRLCGHEESRLRLCGAWRPGSPTGGGGGGGPDLMEQLPGAPRGVSLENVRRSPIGPLDPTSLWDRGL